MEIFIKDCFAIIGGFTVACFAIRCIFLVSNIKDEVRMIAYDTQGDLRGKLAGLNDKIIMIEKKLEET